MRFLTRDAFTAKEAVSLEALIEEAYEEAKKYQPVRSSRLSYENGVQPIIVTCDRPALRHALMEILLNALQANPADAKICVRAHLEGDPKTRSEVRIEIQDNGPGFPAEVAQHAVDPFFTTRNVGLGLGLAVSRKIIEAHQGTLTLGNAQDNHSGVVRISLPSGAHV
jgi:signal transduction histidine kinase